MAKSKVDFAMIRGNSYYDQGDYDKAIADWEKALELDPNNAQAQINLKLRRMGY